MKDLKIIVRTALENSLVIRPGQGIYSNDTFNKNSMYTCTVCCKEDSLSKSIRTRCKAIIKMIYDCDKLDIEDDDDDLKRTSDAALAELKAKMATILCKSYSPLLSYDLLKAIADTLQTTVVVTKNTVSITSKLTYVTYIIDLPEYKELPFFCSNGINIATVFENINTTYSIGCDDGEKVVIHKDVELESGEVEGSRYDANLKDLCIQTDESPSNQAAVALSVMLKVFYDAYGIDLTDQYQPAILNALFDRANKFVHGDNELARVYLDPTLLVELLSNRVDISLSHTGSMINHPVRSVIGMNLVVGLI